MSCGAGEGLMDTWALIVGLGIIISIVAGIIQVLQYVQERRYRGSCQYISSRQVDLQRS